MLRALEGIRVLECGHVHVGPEAAAQLGDLGAEVIKIEPRVTGDAYRGTKTVFGISVDLPGGRSYLFETANRNKKSITLDISKEKGREVVYRLIPKCDVFIQNLRQGALKRAKMDYETLSQFNPRLIYASGTGYGAEGPDVNQPANDVVGVARSGWMAHVGQRHHPPLYPGIGLSDQLAARDLSCAVVVALLVRERLGIGQEVNVSLLGSAMDVQKLAISGCLLLGREVRRPALRATANNPLWCYYRCKDDRWIALGMDQLGRYWRPFCAAIGRLDLAYKLKFEDWSKRAEECEEAIAILDELFTTKTMKEWLLLLREKGNFIAASVQSHSEVVTDPQVVANKYVVDVDHPVLGKVKMQGCPMGFSKTPASIHSGAPELGQHTEEVLQEVGGYSWEEIAELREEEVI